MLQKTGKITDILSNRRQNYDYNPLEIPLNKNCVQNLGFYAFLKAVLESLPSSLFPLRALQSLQITCLGFQITLRSPNTSVIFSTCKRKLICTVSMTKSPRPRPPSIKAASREAQPKPAQPTVASGNHPTAVQIQKLRCLVILFKRHAQR